ncbi:MAG: hypothetical protein D6737_11875 [Chloroflexi bacterium]|nr:MAG: hypothetical protein D6737_11875 [Chloroflexota bacterium]
MDILRFLHSWVRWIIVAVALLAIIRSFFGWSQHRPFDALSRGLMAGFAMLMSLQFVLGVIFLIVLSIDIGFQRHYGEHAFVMLLAVGASHGYRRILKNEDDRVKHRNSLILILITFILLIIGITLLPASISWELRTSL